MNRRSFLASLAASASALVLPYEPKRVYSFMPGRPFAGINAWLPDGLYVDERGQLQKAGGGPVELRLQEQPGIVSGRAPLAQIEAQQLALRERWARDFAFYASAEPPDFYGPSIASMLKLERQ